VNPLQRGIDPYADAELTRRLMAPQAQVSHVDLENATSVFTVAQITGRIRKLKGVITVVPDTTLAVLTITTPLGAMTATVNIPIGGAVGDIVSASFADEVNSVVVEGDKIEIASNGAPATVGSVDLYLEIDPGTRAADGS